MKIVDNLRRGGERVISAPHEELQGWRRFARRNIDLGRFCYRRMKSENAPAMSAALSFRTIFALIPALVLAAVILRPFGLLEKNLNEFLSAFGIEQIVVSKERVSSPGAPKEEEAPVEVLMLSEKIQDMVGSIERKITFGRVGPIGVVLLIWTVISLLTTTEKSLNRVFGARRVRPFGKRMLLYWSVVTLCPLLLITAIYVGGIGVQGLGGVPVARYLGEAIDFVAPLAIGVLLIALVYKLMPNTNVKFSSALTGALVMVPFFAIAKWGITLNIDHVVVGGSLYGALGLLPLFLIWLNLSWMLFILGAVLAHTVANFSDLLAAEEAEKFIQSPSARVAAAVAVAKPYEAGAGPVPLKEIAARLKLPGVSVEGLLDKLATMKVVSRVETPAVAYVLARPSSKIPLTELLEIDHHSGWNWAVEYDPEITASVESFRGQTRGALGQLTLADFIAAKS